MMGLEHPIALRCHSATPSTAVHAIQVLVRRPIAAELRVRFRLDGDLPRIRVPALGVTRVGKELWRHTCFEVFIAIEERTAYHEFNFAPSREWALRAFSSYRNGAPAEEEAMPPELAIRADASRLELDALIRLDALSPIHAHETLRLGLCAVIEADDGFSYWALNHPQDRPDFHDTEGFALRVQSPGLSL